MGRGVFGIRGVRSAFGASSRKVQAVAETGPVDPGSRWNACTGFEGVAIRSTTKRPPRRPRRNLTLRLLLAAGIGLVPQMVEAQDAAHPGKASYDRWCAGCHGVDGAGGGDAAAYMLPRPRDFTKALYQVRTTASGQLPTDADIHRIIDDGMPGTAMPGWRELLTQTERDNLVAYLKTFSRFFEQGPAPEPLSIGSAPRASEEAIAEGREFYQRIECWKCHGDGGRGDGQSAPTQTDDEGFPIRPADLTEPWTFNGGSTVEDIYRTLLTGLDGTPMPSFRDLLAAEFMTEDQLWNVALYVRSLGPEGSPPRVREVVRAMQVETLPGEPGDSAWNDVDRFYIPLVGQIIVRPRWFAPQVDGVWVQAAHDGNELVMRLSWSDPSQSPDPVWADWRQLVTSTMEPKEDVAGAAVPAASGPAADADAADGGGADGSGAAAQLPPLADAIAVQFPRTVPEGMERPYFLMGSTRDPVYLWHWSSETQQATEQMGRGPGRLDPVPGEGTIASSAVWSNGQWQLTLRRSLVVGDTAEAASGAEAGTAEAESDTDRLRFTTRQPIPMAIFAWDGDNGESGMRGSISTWYFIYLDEPTSGTVYATPVLAVLLTAGLGLVAVRRAQRRNGAGIGDKESLDA